MRKHFNPRACSTSKALVYAFFISVCLLILSCEVIHDENLENNNPESSSTSDSLIILKEGICTNCPETEQIGVITAESEYYDFLESLNIFYSEDLQVDFTKQVVIGAFLGMRNSGGYSVTIEAVDSTTISVIETQPGPSCLTNSALTYPYSFAVFPKPTANIEIERISKINCENPIPGYDSLIIEYDSTIIDTSNSNGENPKIEQMKITEREHGYSNLNNLVITSEQKLNEFLDTIKTQDGWNNQQDFLIYMESMDIAFDSSNLFLYFHTETSGSNIIELSKLSWSNDSGNVAFNREVPEIGTDDMAYYGYAFKATKEIGVISFQVGENYNQIAVTDTVINFSVKY